MDALAMDEVAAATGKLTTEMETRSLEQIKSAALLMPAVLSAGEVQEKRSVHGHMQPYILENATEACTEPTREKFEIYIQQLRQLVEVRRTDLKTIHTASCLHRLSRAALSLSNVSLLPHML